MGKGAKHGENELSLKTAGYFKTGPRHPIRQFGFPRRARFDVLVRERPRGTKLQGAFDKKS